MGAGSCLHWKTPPLRDLQCRSSLRSTHRLNPYAIKLNLLSKESNKTEPLSLKENWTQLINNDNYLKTTEMVQ